MKKLFLVAAIGAFVACNNSTGSEVKVDSAAKAATDSIKVTGDSAKAAIDSTVKAGVDSVKAKVDSVKK